MGSEEIGEFQRLYQKLDDVLGSLLVIPAETLKEQVAVAYYQTIKKELNQIFSMPEGEWGALLESFYKKNWLRIQGSFLCYTAKPNSECNLLLGELAEALVKQKNSMLSNTASFISILEILMPTVERESLHGTEEYPSLSLQEGDDGMVRDINLNKVLRTHILGGGGKYLVPIRLLLDIDKDNPKQPLFNPYFDVFSHRPEEALITPLDYQKLCEHSPPTQAFVQALEKYRTLVNSHEHLLGQLNILRNKLYFNSAGALGQETDAGIGTYTAIQDFYLYYEKLSTEQKKSIPSKIIEEIALLAGDAKKNHAKNFDTCINTRRLALAEAMKGHEALLGQIKVGDEQNALLIQQAEEELKRAHNELKAYIQAPLQESGSSLGITHSLLDSLNMKLRVNSLDDLEHILSNHPDDIKVILADEALKKEIAKLFSLNTFAAFIINLHPLKLSTFLESMSDALVEKGFIRNKHQLSLIMEYVGSEKGELIKQLLTPAFLKSMILDTRWKEIMKLFQKSPSRHIPFMYEKFKEEIASLVTSTSRYYELLKYIPKTKKIELFERFQPLLKKANAAELPRLLKNIPLKKAQIFLADLSAEERSAIAHSLRNGLEFKFILRFIAPSLRPSIAAIFKERLFTLIHTARDYNDVFFYLNEQQNREIYEQIKDKLPGLIKTPEDYKLVFAKLLPEQRSYIGQAYLKLQIVQNNKLTKAHVHALKESLSKTNPSKGRNDFLTSSFVVPFLAKESRNMKEARIALKMDYVLNQINQTEDVNELKKILKDLIQDANQQRNSFHVFGKTTKTFDGLVKYFANLPEDNEIKKKVGGLLSIHEMKNPKKWKDGMLALTENVADLSEGIRMHH